MNSSAIETLTQPDVPGLRVCIEYETDPMSPADWDNFGKIAYCSSRETLGTERVSRDRLQQIAEGIAKGDLIGMPVYAYVHSGATIRCGQRLRDGTFIPGNPFSCPWDSGQSGYVYVSKDAALKEFSRQKISPNLRNKIIKMLAAEVETFDMYLTGDVYSVCTYQKVDGEWDLIDSLGSVYGLEYARDEAKSTLKYQAELLNREKNESTYWAERGVPTQV